MVIDYTEILKTVGKHSGDVYYSFGVKIRQDADLLHEALVLLVNDNCFVRQSGVLKGSNRFMELADTVINVQTGRVLKYRYGTLGTTKKSRIAGCQSIITAIMTKIKSIQFTW